MNIPPSISTLLIGIVLTLVSIWYGQNHHLLPSQASEEALLIDNLFNAMMTIGTGLFLLVIGVILFSAIRFRQKAGDRTDGPPVHGNIPLEILWTAIPSVIVLGISIYSFEIYNQIGGLNPMDHHAMAHASEVRSVPGSALAATLEAPPRENLNQQIQEEAIRDPATAAVRNETIPQLKDAPERGVTSGRIGPTPDKVGKLPEYAINVTGLQYAWIFTYPDTGVVSGELHVPVGREIRLDITANDVLHAFWVPEFRLKQDAIPGRQSELRFTPSKPGTYPVICAELCGAYHGAMKTTVIAETPEDFNTWLKSQQVANQEENLKTIALQPTEPSTEDFLAPYVAQMGIPAEAIQQISDPHQSYPMSGHMASLHSAS
ncbi:MAG: cytochrome c oxidase subunit II [Leptolyngbyaceae cyanobacterium bins.59]|nr:cytochrome c oxidase subunit II [Leptolyngbyaceae cyanobacterium bins.59]